MASTDTTRDQQNSQPAAGEVFWAFLKLGVTAFGGPVAHIGYFRAEFVDRRRWLDDSRFSDLLALCQFLPGPASSQLGIALGLGRAGWSGALAAWVGFTLPSAFALILFGYGVTRWSGITSSGLIHGLKIAAVAIVAQAVWGMAKSLSRGRTRAAISVAAAALLVTLPSGLTQIAAIAIGGIAGYVALVKPPATMLAAAASGLSRRTGACLLLAFATLLIVLPVWAGAVQSLSMQAIAAFYQAGALVFGGGHVVLPLLESSVVGNGWLDRDAFLAGYGAAQAVPGPLFTFAAYLGAVMPGPLQGWAGGLTMLVAIFAPGALLIAGAMPFWETLRQRRAVQNALAGVNAAVVGILAAALYDPVWTSAIHRPADVALALTGFVLLLYGHVSPVVVVLLSAIGGWALMHFF